MKTLPTRFSILIGAMTLSLLAQQAHAAIALDRTRVIFDGRQKSMSVTITNQNKSLPYLAQSWLEDANGKKIDSPATALPPLQRVEPGSKGQIKIQFTTGQNALPQDKESLFYFNVREIPPKSSKPNTLQLALQTRVKMFYRPAGIAVGNGKENDAAKQLTLSRQGDDFQLNNPTPYFISIIGAESENGSTAGKYKPVMVAPKSSIALGVKAASLGNHPVLTFINDYGGRPELIFTCSGSTCSVSNVKAG